MRKSPFTYTILQYRHDVWTGEALNIGVLLHCADQGYLKLLARYGRGRIGQAYPDLDATALRTMTQSLERRVEKERAFSCSLYSRKRAIDLARAILKDDESSMRWHVDGSGLTLNAEEAHEQLFSRFVTRFDKAPNRPHRSDQEVYDTIKRQLEMAELLDRIKSKTVTSQFGRVTFDYTFQNGILHCIQPLSFDSADEETMQTKAEKWVGRMHTAAESQAKLKVYFVTGKPNVAERPESTHLLKSYESMKRLLLTAPAEVAPEVIEEDESSRVVDALRAIHA